MGKSDVNQQGSDTATCFTPDEDAAWLCSAILFWG